MDMVGKFDHLHLSTTTRQQSDNTLKALHVSTTSGDIQTALSSPFSPQNVPFIPRDSTFIVVATDSQLHLGCVRFPDTCFIPTTPLGERVRETMRIMRIGLRIPHAHHNNNFANRDLVVERGMQTRYRLLVGGDQAPTNTEAPAPCRFTTPSPALVGL